MFYDGCQKYIKKRRGYSASALSSSKTKFASTTYRQVVRYLMMVCSVFNGKWVNGGGAGVVHISLKFYPLTEYI